MDQIESPKAIFISKEVDQLVQNLDQRLHKSASPAKREKEIIQCYANTIESKLLNETSLNTLKNKLNQTVKRNSDLQNQLIVKETQLNCLILQNSDYKRTIEELQNKLIRHKAIITEKEKDNSNLTQRVQQLESELLINKSKCTKLCMEQEVKQLDAREKSQICDEIQKYVNFITYKLKDSLQLQQIFQGRFLNLSFQKLLKKQDFIQLANKSIKLLADLIVYISNYKILSFSRSQKELIQAKDISNIGGGNIFNLEQVDNQDSFQFSKESETDKSNTENHGFQNTLNHSQSSQDIRGDQSSQGQFPNKTQKQLHKLYQSQRQVYKLLSSFIIKQKNSQNRNEQQKESSNYLKQQAKQRHSNISTLPQCQQEESSSNSISSQEFPFNFQNKDSHAQESSKIQQIQQV